MSYQVLARKWRPHKFDEVVGQQHVLQSLIHALDGGRLHHAYLLTGTRGVGKTTLSRILAKCLNCEKGVTSIPCGECSACTQIDAGRFIDLIEIDAASKTKVEDTRELLDNVQFAPVVGRFKIYLIDEVHMLSTHSFNALLKTLEEPPEHVKFLLATTDPQKLPITVLSRCLQFHLKNIPADLIAKQLAYVLENEEVTFDAPALDAISRNASGSMRDALSLLDQAIAYGQGTVKKDAVLDMLGNSDDDQVVELAMALAQENADMVFNICAQLHEHQTDYIQVLGRLSRALFEAARIQLFEGIDGEFDADKIQALSQALSATQLQVLYQITLTAAKDLPIAPEMRTAFEMTMLRLLAFTPQGTTTTAAPVKKNTAKPTPIATKAPLQQAQFVRPTPAAPTQDTAPTMPSTSALTPSEANWHDIVNQLPLQGVVMQLAKHTSFLSYQNNLIELNMARSHAALAAPKLVAQVQTALSTYFGVSLTLDLKNTSAATIQTPATREKAKTEQNKADAKTAIESDANVQFMMNEMGATVVPDSIKTIGEQ
jgi:DNA polymerase-3 subunit gamma/tau